LVLGSFLVVVSGGLARAEDTPTGPSQDELFGVVIGALQAEDDYVRRSAARVLHMFSGRPVLDRLVEALSDEDENVAQAALDSLGELGDEGGLPAIERYMRKHQDSSLAMFDVLDALHLIAKPSGVEQVKTMLRYMQDDSTSQADDIRSYATYVLGRIGTAEAKTVLRTLMNDRAVKVRISASGNLAFLGEEDARSSLENLQGDPEHSDYARSLLHVVSKQPSQRERSQGLLWMLRLHDLNTPKIRKGWETKILDTSLPAWHRGSLMGFYAEFIGKDARAFLGRLLQDSDSSIQIYAAGALLRLGDLSAIPVLQEELESPTNGLAWIVDKLEPIDNPVKKPLLLLAYNSHDRLAKVAAAGQLYKLALQDDAGEQRAEETPGTDGAVRP